MTDDLRSRPRPKARPDQDPLTTLVERAYAGEQIPDWGLLFDLTRRALSGHGDHAERGAGPAVVGG